MKAKVSEVFFSVQGEGPYIGTGHVFIRFFGCNILCDFCDTKKGKFRSYSEASLKERVENILNKSQARFISLTGGEPLLQADFIESFISKARFRKEFIYLETNGILYHNFQKIKSLVDIVSMDIKLPSITLAGEFWHEHEKFLKSCLEKDVFVKVVVDEKAKKSEIIKAAQLVAKIDKKITFIIQPNHAKWGNSLINKSQKFQLLALQYLDDVRIIPQMHKILGIK